MYNAQPGLARKIRSGSDERVNSLRKAFNAASGEGLESPCTTVVTTILQIPLYQLRWREIAVSIKQLKRRGRSASARLEFQVRLARNRLQQLEP